MRLQRIAKGDDGHRPRASLILGVIHLAQFPPPVGDQAISDWPAFAGPLRSWMARVTLPTGEPSQYQLLILSRSHLLILSVGALPYLWHM